MKRIKNAILQMLAIAACICIYSSCSGDSYLNAIPANANALMAINAGELGKANGKDGREIMKSIFKADGAESCGIDFASKLYFFETGDGNMGCCAKVDSKEELTEWLEALAEKGLCSKVTERRDLSFALIHNSWAIGFSGKAAVIMGPVLPAQQADAVRTLSKYLKQDEDEGIMSSPLFDKVDNMNSAIAIVAQSDALPEKFAAPFTLGAPKEADASQICIAASLTATDNGCLHISGEPFSLDSSIDKALGEARGKFRKITGRYTGNMPGRTLCSIFMNVDGHDFVTMMHNSKSLGVLLAGVNTAIDMDNILRSVNGEMAIGVEELSETGIKISMAAQLADEKFLRDVDYWKKSCQPGNSISDCGKKRYVFRSKDNQFWFGVSDSKEFYASSEESVADNILGQAESQLPDEVRKQINGQRLCIVINANQLAKGNESLSAVAKLTVPLFGKLNYIVYSIK